MGGKKLFSTETMDLIVRIETIYAPSSGASASKFAGPKKALPFIQKKKISLHKLTFTNNLKNDGLI